ncbi:MAG: cytochrome C [Verrucomicrobia bacterium]|nr:cytochrome C [Verrucomicrobiota bacterium]
MKPQNPNRLRRGAVLLTAALAVTLAWAADAPKKDAKKSSGPPVPKLKKNDLAPLPAGEKPASSHAPFEDGDCSLCHKSKDPKNPGPITTNVNAQCLGCHEDFAPILARKSSHVAAKENCCNCHNPHNARQRKLLVESGSTLCLSCHEAIRTLTVQAKVKHEALTQGSQCSNCHNPHGANVEHLLVQLPFDLCVSCHGKDDVKDDQGKKLTNVKSLLDANKEWHGPVSQKDCSACHQPHGSANFRLLAQEYPPQFYSPYDPKLYGLCFECHEDTILAQPQTTTLTRFRNGGTNLHYVHVHKTERGRTCRACHEVHASKQKHQIRDAVPYGSRGWMLKVNYTQLPNGGMCDKTCHDQRVYTNSVPVALKAK